MISPIKGVYIDVSVYVPEIGTKRWATFLWFYSQIALELFVISLVVTLKFTEDETTKTWNSKDQIKRVSTREKRYKFKMKLVELSLCDLQNINFLFHFPCSYSVEWDKINIYFIVLFQRLFAFIIYIKHHSFWLMLNTK